MYTTLALSLNLKYGELCKNNVELSGSHGGEYEHGCPVGCCAV
jgi:hypothetical protein